MASAPCFVAMDSQAASGSFVHQGSPGKHGCNHLGSAGALGVVLKSLLQNRGAGWSRKRRLILSRGAPWATVTDQADHRPDAKSDLPGNAADADPLGPQGQSCLHFLDVALLDAAATELLAFGSRTSKSDNHALSDCKTPRTWLVQHAAQPTSTYEPIGTQPLTLGESRQLRPSFRPLPK
jgi:hypothetical protein